MVAPIWAGIIPFNETEFDMHRLILPGLIVVLLALPRATYADNARAKCVDMAAFPGDPASDEEGGPDHLVPMPLALSACREAVAIAPESALHLFLLG